jgi:hypothetical protein
MDQRLSAKTLPTTGRVLANHSISVMQTASTLVSPPDLMVAEDEKGQLSALVQIKLEETKTLTTFFAVTSRKCG